MEFHRDCKSFPGIYPCDILKGSDQLDCKDCKFYEKIGKKILIIKLGAIGDVLRTTTILTAIKEKYGNNTHITWIVDPASKDLLKSNTLIDRVWTIDEKNELKLAKEKFDI
jgi:heptosyltransferase-2